MGHGLNKCCIVSFASGDTITSLGQGMCWSEPRQILLCTVTTIFGQSHQAGCLISSVLATRTNLTSLLPFSYSCSVHLAIFYKETAWWSPWFMSHPDMQCHLLSPLVWTTCSCLSSLRVLVHTLHTLTAWNLYTEGRSVSGVQINAFSLLSQCQIGLNSQSICHLQLLVHSL